MGTRTRRSVGRPRIYSDEQIEQAKHLYVEFGPQEASRQTGISAAWITKKAKAAGLSTVHKENLQNATETAAERWHLKQERLIEGIIDMALDALYRAEPASQGLCRAGRARDHLRHGTPCRVPVVRHDCREERQDVGRAGEWRADYPHGTGERVRGHKRGRASRASGRPRARTRATRTAHTGQVTSVGAAGRVFCGSGSHRSSRSR